MILDYRLKNFRVFGDYDDIIDIAPITILTGCNNSGKSSIVKSLCLLNDFCKQLKGDLEEGRKLRLQNYKWNFRKFPFNQMGSFKNIVHKSKEGEDATSANEGVVTMELSVRSQFLMEDVKMKLHFCSEEEDELNNGYLQSYSIETMDGKTIFKASKDGGYSMNFEIVKERIIYFFNCQDLAAKYQAEAAYASQSHHVWYEPNDAELDKSWNDFVTVLKDLEAKYGVGASWEVLEWQLSKDRHINESNIIGSSAGSAFDIKNRETELAKGSELGVFCYYPVLDLLKDIPKEEIREFIFDKLQDKIERIEDHDMEAITFFIDYYMKSDCLTIHELVRREENKLLIQNGKNYGDNPFCEPTIVGQMPVSLGKDHVEVFNIDVVFRVLGVLNQYMTESGKSYNEYDEIDMSCRYKYLYTIDRIIAKFLENIWIQLIPGEIYYTGTNSVDVKRLYSLEDSSDFVITLKQFLKNKREIKQRKLSNSSYKSTVLKYEPGTFMDKWLSKFEIAHHVSIDVHADGYGAIIRLYEDEKDKEGLLLADKGYGVTQLFAILLKIENAIIQTTLNAMNHRYNLTGFDIKEGLRSYTYLHPVTVALEEPENHLHPSKQSTFAEMIVDAYKEYGVQFLIESHSEYIIRKLQTVFAEGKLTDPDIRLLYVNSLKGKDKNTPQVYRIGINEDGSLDNVFGKGFLDEADSLVSDLFNIKMRTNAKA